MKTPRPRLSSEIVKRGYTDEEVAHIYALARFSLENGDIRRAELIASGLVEVAPEFSPAWLCLAAVQIQNKSYDSATSSAAQALKVEPDSVPAFLYLITCHLITGDFNSAGTYLGEVGERIEAGVVDDPDLIRFYNAQLARFQSR